MIFFDVDTQRDFMDQDGALYVSDAESIKPNLERLLRAASAHGITTISSGCAHQPNDPEFRLFPPHCLDGTHGAERVFANLPALSRQEIAVEAISDLSSSIAPNRHYLVKKKVFDLFSNAWLDGLRKRGVFKDETCIVFGVATDYCVRCCALGLAMAGAHVYVIEDAVRGVAKETTTSTIAEMRAAGIEFTTTDKVLNQLQHLKSETRQ